MAGDIDSDLLSALDGIAYIVDAGGTIIAYNRSRWDEFAAANDGAELCADGAVSGRHLLDFVHGDEIRDAYSAFADALLDGSLRRIVLTYSCDSPDRQRKMRLAITSLHSAGRGQALLYHSVVLEEHLRPAIGLFDFKAMLNPSRSTSDWPILVMCSFCQNVGHPAGSSPETCNWVGASQYYGLGGSAEVRISHGVCPTCRDTKLTPHLRHE
jgi:hypothetical protein